MYLMFQDSVLTFVTLSSYIHKMPKVTLQLYKASHWQFSPTELLTSEHNSTTIK